MYKPYIILPILLTIAIPLLIEAFKCDASDRTYMCDCIFEPTNDSVIVEDDDKYNTSASHFIPTLKSLHYCEGSFQCKPKYAINKPSDPIRTNSSLICFGDDSCLSNGGFEVASLKGFKNACVKNSCLYLKDLIMFNVTDGMLQVDSYMCIRVSPEKLKAPYCLKPACKSFMAIEKLCVCNYETRSCTCSSFCHNLLTTTTYKTYGLFLSFADVYTTKGSKGPFLHWIILLVLCIGLTILLIIFCRLCKAAVDPTRGNEVQNPEIFRRILTANVESGSASASTTAKSSFSAVERCSPPPSYEQVLKDKCIEFKKSVA